VIDELVTTLRRTPHRAEQRAFTGKVVAEGAASSMRGGTGERERRRGLGGAAL